MATNKTNFTDASVEDFLESFVESEQKKTDSRHLIALFKKWTGNDAVMYGPSIIGFGKYAYTYESGHSGEAPMLAFSPRKASLTLYVFSPNEENRHLLEGLGKYKISKACIYVNKLADIDLKVLEKLCKHSVTYLKKHFRCECKG